MQEIQNQAIETYLANLEFFKNNYVDLYERIIILSNAIDTNQYKERYHLEYIQDDQQFDIFDTHHESYLYNRKPNEFNKTAVNSSNFDKENSIDLLREDYYNAKQLYKTDETLNITARTMHKCVNDISQYSKLFKAQTTSPTKKFQYIEKFIFAGTLLGGHIQGIVNKLKFRLCIIYEYNLEIFRLSLFITNYVKVAQKTKIIFSIMDDINILEQKLKQFLPYEFRSNYMLKYFSTHYNLNNFFDTLRNIQALEDPFSVNYYKLLEGLITPSLDNISKYNTLDTSKIATLLTNIPVLLLAAGPSFGKQIEWIKIHKNNFLIVAIGAVVEKLISEDIVPDLIVSVDPDEKILQQFPEHIHNKIKNIPFLTAAATHKSILQLFNTNNITLYETMTHMKENSKLIEGFSVGEISLELCLILGANRLYLLGSDLSFDHESGSSHFGNHQGNFNTHSSQQNSLQNNTVDFKEYTQSIKGNLRDTVSTNIYFKRSISLYEDTLKKYSQNNPNIQVFNLSDGAYFQGAFPTKIEELQIEKEHFKIDVSSDLQKLSEIGFNKKELENIHSIVELLDTLNDAIKLVQKRKYKNYTAFVIDRYEIFRIINEDLKRYDGFLPHRIFMLYILSIEPYLGYQFNDKNILNESNILKKVKKIWCIDMLSLIDDYKKRQEKLR